MFCADAASKFVRAWVAESFTISDSDVAPIRLLRKSKAEAAEPIKRASPE